MRRIGVLVFSSIFKSILLKGSIIFAESCFESALGKHRVDAEIQAINRIPVGISPGNGMGHLDIRDARADVLTPVGSIGRRIHNLRPLHRTGGKPVIDHHRGRGRYLPCRHSPLPSQATNRHPPRYRHLQPTRQESPVNGISKLHQRLPLSKSPLMKVLGHM